MPTLLNQPRALEERLCNLRVSGKRDRVGNRMGTHEYRSTVSSVDLEEPVADMPCFDG